MQISEFKASLVYRGTLKKVRVTQRNPASKRKKKKKKNKKKERKGKEKKRKEKRSEKMGKIKGIDWVTISN